MTATNNFKVFNENFSNVQSDAAYLADAQRIGGVVPGVAPSALHNKMYRQVSIMAAALGQVIANRGYNASDVDLAALVSALSSAFSPSATSANIALYVATTGSDANDGLTSGTPLRNIQTAINRIPQIVNHSVTINVAAGTYAEDLTIQGFTGKGSVNLIGAGSVLSDLYVVNSLLINQCTCIVIVTGFKFVSTTVTAVTVGRSIDTRIVYSRINTAASQVGIAYSSTNNGQILNCEISNRTTAISADGATTLLSSVNTGSGNTTGLSASGASTIGKNSTQPAGTTAEVANQGGVIR